MIQHQNVSVFAGAAHNLQERISMILDNEQWKKFDPEIKLTPTDEQEFKNNYAIKSSLVNENNPLLNSHAWQCP